MILCHVGFLPILDFSAMFHILCILTASSTNLRVKVSSIYYFSPYGRTYSDVPVIVLFNLVNLILSPVSLLLLSKYLVSIVTPSLFEPS